MIKKDDNVIVVTGKDKGKTGKVTKVFPKENRVLVAGVNMKKKHQKARRSNEKGQIVESAYPIHISNVMFLDQKTGKPTRIGKKLIDGKMVRISKKSNIEI